VPETSIDPHQTMTDLIYKHAYIDKEFKTIQGLNLLEFMERRRGCSVLGLARGPMDTIKL
jgi:hypothetical protein